MSTGTTTVVLTGEGRSLDTSLVTVDVSTIALEGSRVRVQPCVRSSQRYAKRLSIPTVVPTKAIMSITPTIASEICSLVGSDDSLTRTKVSAFSPA